MHRFLSYQPLRVPWEIQPLVKIPVLLYVALVLLALLIVGLELAFSSSIRAITAVFYLLGLATWFIYGGALRASLATTLLVAAFLVALTSWLGMRLHYPELAHTSLRAEGVLNKFVFLLFAFLLAGRVRNVFMLWAVALLAVVTYPWTNGEGWSEVTAMLSDRRAGMGTNPLRSGLIWGTVFLGLCCFSYRFIFRPEFSIFRSLIWFALTVAALLVALAAQTRAVYAGLAVVAVVAVAALAVGALTHANKKAARRTLLGVLGMLIVLLALAVQSPYMERTVERTQNEMEVIQQIARGELGSLPRSNIGLRIYFWQDAASWIAERPIIGWDYRASRVLHEQAGNQFGRRYFHTIHNDYVDILLSFGLLGGVLFAALFGWLSVGSYRAWRAGLMPADFAIFYVCFVVFFSVNSLFMSLLFVHDSIYLFNIMMAGFASFILRHRVQDASRYRGLRRFFV